MTNNHQVRTRMQEVRTCMSQARAAETGMTELHSKPVACLANVRFIFCFVPRSRQAVVCLKPDRVPHVDVWIFLGARCVGTCRASGVRHLDSSWCYKMFRTRQDAEGSGEDGYSGSRGSQRALLRWFERGWPPARSYNLSLSRTSSVAGPHYPTHCAIALLG